VVTSPEIRVYFGLSNEGGDFLTLDDAVKGQLDTAAYPLGDDNGEVIDSTAYEIGVHRGRNRELDEIEAGTCRVALYNNDRNYDPSYTTGSFYPNVVPGKRVTITVYGVVIFDGVIDDWDNRYSVTKETTASFLAVDALGDLGQRDFDEWTATGSQTAGPRIAAILDRDEVRFGSNRNLDTGISSLQGDLITWGSNVLNYCQLVSRTDLGRFFASRTNQMTFLDRHNWIAVPTAVEFADDGTAIPFSGVEVTTGGDLLFNRVGVTRADGELQTVSNDDSINAYGTRALSLSRLLLEDDTEAALMAAYLVGLYKDPDVRISALTVNMGALTSQQQATVAALDIGALIGVTWTPAGVGTPLVRELVVEGVSHQMRYDDVHLMRIATSDTATRSALILNDATYGQLDSNALAY
jgi:hypothetical protein